jgi:hypothetical protein
MQTVVGLRGSAHYRRSSLGFLEMSLSWSFISRLSTRDGFLKPVRRGLCRLDPQTSGHSAISPSKYDAGCTRLLSCPASRSTSR